MMRILIIVEVTAFEKLIPSHACNFPLINDLNTTVNQLRTNCR